MPVEGWAQSRTIKDDEGQALLDRGEYEAAYAVFDQLAAKYQDNIDYKYKLGICCLNYPNKAPRSIELFSQVVAARPEAKTKFYLARAYHQNKEFDKAIVLLDSVQAELTARPGDEVLLADTRKLLSNCKNGRVLVDNSALSQARLLETINTEEFEAVPLLAANDSVLIYTYVGPKSIGGRHDLCLEPDSEGVYGSDIFISRRLDPLRWGEPEAVSELNTIGNDAALALSPSGNTLFVFRSDNTNPGDIYTSERAGWHFGPTKPLNANINSKDHWEGSCAFSPDGRFLYFVSDRPGGQGGRDIWVSEWIDNDWGPASNLGPAVNTPEDEDAPFVDNDGITLFFSSKGHAGVGGYDIFYVMKRDNGWSEVMNLAGSYNTPGDDNFFYINTGHDGAIFSSARQGGTGKSDIYTVNGIDYRKRPSVKVLGVKIESVDLTASPVFQVTKAPNNEIIQSGSFYRESGYYLFPLSPGGQYHVQVTAPGYEDLTFDFAADSSATHQEIMKNLKWRKLGQAAADPALAASGTGQGQGSSEGGHAPGQDSLHQGNVATPGKTKAPSTAGSHTAKNKPKVKPTVLPPSEDIRLNDALRGLEQDRFYFSVQIGAFRNPAKFKYDRLKDLGEVTVIVEADSITRFTQAKLRSMVEAEMHRKKLVRRGIKDAWIVIFVDGRRKTIGQFLLESHPQN